VKYFFLAFLFLTFSFNALAEKVESQIHSLDSGINGQPHLVKLTNGQVAFLEFRQKNLLKKIEQSLQRKDWLQFTLNEQNRLESIQKIAPQHSYEGRGTFVRRDPINPYRPTPVSMEQAKVIFENMRNDYKKVSQCYNRAHIWTYDEFIRSQINSNKVFLFFTSRFIRSHQFKWWFHVTPMLYIGSVSRSNWKILDRRYTHGPINSKTWTDIFIKTKSTCKTVYKYSDYRDHQTTQDCYMIPVSMYYVVPSDIERLESTGEERIGHEELDIEYALWESFPEPI
jgi:hypothetical protein